MVRFRLAVMGLLAAILLAGTGPRAMADVRVVYETDGKPLFTVAAPDGWVVTTGTAGADGSAPRILGMNPEGDLSLWVGLLSPKEPKNLAETEAYIQDLGKNLVKGARVERVEDGRFGKLRARYYVGKGTRQGAPVDFAVVIAALPRRRMVIGLFVGEHGARQVYQAELAAIVGSLRPGGR